MDYVNFVLSEDGIRNVINGEQMEGKSSLCPQT